MAEQECAMSHPVIDITVAIGIPLVSALSAFHIDGERLHTPVVMSHPVGEDLLSPRKELSRVG
jgi:hypothetical protein